MMVDVKKYLKLSNIDKFPKFENNYNIGYSFIFGNYFLIFQKFIKTSYNFSTSCSNSLTYINKLSLFLNE